MGQIEIAGRRVVAVALLGHGERDDPRRRCCEPGQESLGLRRREQRLVQDADHGRRLVDAVILDHGVEAVLRFQRIADGRAAQARTADRPVARLDCKRSLRDHCLVRAVKGAKAQMDDPDPGFECRRGRPRHAGCGRRAGYGAKGGPCGMGSLSILKA